MFRHTTVLKFTSFVSFFVLPIYSAVLVRYLFLNQKLLKVPCPLMSFPAMILILHVPEAVYSSNDGKILSLVI